MHMVRLRATVKLAESPSGIAVPWNPRDVLRAGLVVVVGVVGLAFLLFPIVRSLGGAMTTAAFLFAAILEGVLLIAAWRFGPRKYGTLLATLGFRAPLSGSAFLPWLILLASLAFGYLYITVIAVTGLESLEPRPLPADLVAGTLDRVAMFVLVVVLTPLAEETFFRGFLLPVFVSRWGFVWGASLTSLLFAVSHGTLGMIVPAFGTGLLLAWLYYRTRSLWSCVLTHGAQNALAFAVTFTL